MANMILICSLLLLLFLLGGCTQVKIELFDEGRVEYMCKEEREGFKEQAKEMFYHAYNSYMRKAYPADELMPLSCKGRYRGSEQDRGDIDSALGNFSLTLVDTMDTLVILGDVKEFEKAVKLVINDVSFDTDVIVSLFETNIRMLGGLLSGHVLAEYLQQRNDGFSWYQSELLHLAKDLGYRFLPAFNSTTGIPYGRINLRHGMKGVPTEMMRETCTACAGSMILEMAALSRLTGESIFEEKAQKAMDALWRLRHRGTDLMGSVLNVNSGDWVRRDSGVGAGIDSYYEYCLKAYILLGDEKYLGRFNKHYHAVMKYISQGPMLLDVHMHRPNTNSKNFMDALLAFWPGLQVLKGDIKPAVETHEMLYQVMQRHNFIPEAFTTDFQVHWGHHPLRPEFLESTYFLYKATGDHYYLGVGKKVLKSLQTYARVPCGFAAVSDVRTNKHDDTMDSFVLSETFKYLYLLFADPANLKLDLDEFIFTTEGHLLPLSLASVRTNASIELEKEKLLVEETDRTCPNNLHLFPASVRLPLRNMVEDVCPRRIIKKKLNAVNFQPNNVDHIKTLSDMGITFLTLTDGSVRLLHSFNSAKSPQDAEEGLLFMQDMVELSKTHTKQLQPLPLIVSFNVPNSAPPQESSVMAGPAQFGHKFKKNEKFEGKVIFANPSTACEDLINVKQALGSIVIVERGNCMFVDKARKLQKAGAMAGIVFDNVPASSIHNSRIFAMSGDGKDEADDVTIPFVFLFSVEASQLKQAILAEKSHLIVTIGDMIQREDTQLKAPTDFHQLKQLKETLKVKNKTRSIDQNLHVSGFLPVDEQIFDINKVREDNVPNLKALVLEYPLDQIMKITFDDNSNVSPPENTFDKTKKISNETSWMFMKKVMINELYGLRKFDNLSYLMTGTSLFYYHYQVMRQRGFGVKEILSKSLDDKIRWFLQELALVKPDSSVVQLYEELDGNFNKQIYLSYLFRWIGIFTKKLSPHDRIYNTTHNSEFFIKKLMLSAMFDKNGNLLSRSEWRDFVEKFMVVVKNFIVDRPEFATPQFDTSDFLNLSFENLSTLESPFGPIEKLYNKYRRTEKIFQDSDFEESLIPSIEDLFLLNEPSFQNFNLNFVEGWQIKALKSYNVNLGDNISVPSDEVDNIQIVDAENSTNGPSEKERRTHEDL